MLSLKDREWQPFYFRNIFTEMKRGKRLKTADHCTGTMPYVSSSALNNGVDNFISNNDGVRIFNNCLSLANSGSVGRTFYHCYSFVASDHVTELKNPLFSRHIYLFLLPAVSRLKEKYNFNREINDHRINAERLLLPVNQKDEPDWAFMDEYIREREQLLLQRYIAFVEDNAAVSSDLTPLTNKEWSEFKVADYFAPKRGRENNMTCLSSGDRPLISAKNGRNGLKAFVSVPHDRLHAGHTITLNNDGDGGAGLAYYQPFPFALDTHVTSLRPKNELSYYALVFASAAIAQQRESFGHSHSISDNRLKAMKCMLPAACDGQPDWEYMEQYTKTIACRQVEEYLGYIKARS